MFQLYRRIVIGILLCVAGHSAAQAEMLQFSTPDGMKSWPKLNDPADWHQDQESSLRLNANSLIPDGVDPANAEVTIQARGFSRINNSLSQMVEKDRAAAPAGTQVKQLPDVADKDGTPFNLYSFAPPGGAAGSWKAVAYSEEGDILLAFTLNARTHAAYESNFPVFVGVVQKYAKDIPW
ncbi:MAG: hypothetical protein ABI608_00410 [Rhizomicrobium sp.]